MNNNKCVYIGLVINQINIDCLNMLYNLSNSYGKLTVGINSDYVHARLYGDNSSDTNAETISDFLKQLKFIDQVILLDDKEFSYQDMYAKLHFDICFYGSEYGTQFEKDKQFFAEQGVCFLPILPHVYTKNDSIDCLQLSLKNLPKDKKLILFGTGKYFDLFMKNYSDVHSIAYAVDTNSKLWNSKKQAIEINSPEVLKNENSADCLIILCAKDFSTMKEVISQYGDFDYRTLRFFNPVALAEEMYISLKAETDYLIKAHKINMIMMKEVDRVCRKYDIPYYVICGSLIGVVRHKGLIPWDDDIDLAFTREGFNKLKEVARTEWTQGDFSFVDCDGYGNGAFLDFMPRVIYNKERVPVKIYDKVNGKASVDVKDKLCVDCYIFEDAGSNPKKHYQIVKLLQAIYAMCMGHRAYINYDEYKRLPKKMYRVLVFLTKIGSLIPLNFLIACYEHFRRFAIKENSEYYFCANLSINCIDRRIKKSFFGNGIEMNMGDIKVTVPSDYDSFLEAMNYHDYMNFPPLSIRKPSHYFNSDISIW